MNDSTIRWDLFWKAVDAQNSAALDQWLSRWAFADDAVRLSMRRSIQNGNSFRS